MKMKFNLLTFLLLSSINIFAQGELCDGALFLDCFSVEGNNDTALSTTDSYCGTSTNLSGPEIVYTITPTNTQLYQFTLNVFGTGDLDMFLLEDDCDPSSCIVNSDAASSTADDIMSATLLAGTTYYLVIDGDDGSIAEYFLDVICSPPFECESEDIFCDESISSDNDTGISTVDTYCGGSSINLTGPERIFRFSPSVSQTYTITLSGFSGDLDMFILDSACDPDSCIDNSDGPSSTSTDVLTLFLNGGQDYYIVVDGDGGTISTFDLFIQCAPECEASFTWEEDCGKVQFTSTATGTSLSYEWTIDGITYNIANPCHQFLTQGPHTIIFEVFSFGCEDSFTQEIEVEICSQELFCECCDEEDINTFESETLGPVTTFPQAPFNAVYGAPMYVDDGCNNPVSIQVNGPTLGFGGDGVEFSLSGFGGPTPIFVEGTQYCISYCYKAPEEAGSLKLRISDTQQTNGACSGICNVLHTSPVINPIDDWQTDQFTFTANNNYFSLTFSTDATGVLDGIVPILFDNVCISEYTDTCKADFSWSDDGCGNVILTDESCGDDINILWNVNGTTSTSSPYTITGPGTFNVTLSITGADGCSDSKTETIIITAPQTPVLVCPAGETITELIPQDGLCTSLYTVPPVSSSTGSPVTCTFNGNIITPGAVVQLQAGINLFSCFTIDDCDQSADCSWQVVLICEEEEPEVCDIDPNCPISNTLNLGTGIDLNGNQIPSGLGQVDPFWRLINNAPIQLGCSSPFLPTINGSAYLMNYVFPNTTAWVNLPGVTNIAPVDLGNGSANLFGCNNLQNTNGDRVPYIFERIFCICEEDELDFQFTYTGDDRMTLELWDLDNNVLLGMSSTYIYTGAAAPSTWNYTGVFPQGSYAVRAKLANVSSTTLGFSIIASATSLTNNSTIINAGECCESYTVNIRKIIDNDCSGTVTAGDTPGQGWNFILKDALGIPIQNQTSDINGEVFFTGLPLGNYTIEEVIIPGFSAVSPTGGTQNITITQNSWNTFDFFNCQSPEVICDSLMVMVEELIDPNGENLCCYDFDLKNNWGPDIVNVEVEMLTKDWQFNNVVLDPGFILGPCTSTNDLFCVSGTTGSIPSGLNLDAINTCITPAVMNPSTPQMIEFRWMQQVAEDLTIVACRDTIFLECDPPPPDPCVEVIECEIMCSDPDNPFEYELCFSINNNTGFDIGSITLEDLPSNFGWQPFCTTSTTIMPVPSPILDGSSSGQMCVKLKSTTPIITPQNLCFKIGVVSVDGKECCHNPEEICKAIEPCCDPCEDNGITATPYGGDDECCYVIDVDNGCQTGYFTKFEAEINTTGVCFGGHVINPIHAGFFNVTSTNKSICMRPKSGTMDNPSYPGLLDFCLDKIDDPSQSNPQINFKWYAINPLTGQEEVVCTDLFETNCTPPDSNVCVVITEPFLECIPDSNKYRYTFTVTNVSFPAFTADKLHLTVKNDPFNYVPFPTGNVIPLTPPLGPNQSRVITTCIVGTPFPQTTYPNFEFGYRLQNMITGDCCFESACDTIPIPPCGIQSCCDITDEAFCDYFDSLISYTEEECKVIMNFDQLDSCDAVIVTLPDGTSNTPTVGDTLCIPVENGPAQICVQIDRWNNVINELLPCITKDTCFTVNPSCMPPDTCPDCPSGMTATDLVINGDFEAGNVGFTNDYTVGPPGLTTGEYDVRISSFLGNSNWAASDPTNGPTGRMLVVDGPLTGAIWRQSVTVVPGQTYFFCALVNNLVTLNLNETFPPTIELRINTTDIVINATAIPQTPDQWVLLTGSWVASSNSATLELFNTELGGFGDVAVDNISFISCGTETMDECCEDFDEFCNLIDLSYDVTENNCEVIVKATQFDSCHWMYNVSPDWGDGSIILPTVSPANGCWSHVYDQPGTYNICSTIYEGTMDGDTCWTKEICVPVTVDCPTSCDCLGWDDMTVSGTWGTINNVTCNQTVDLPACEYIFSIDGSFQCLGSDCNPSYDWSLTKIGGNCVSPCIGNFGTGSNINLAWDLSPTADPTTSGPGTYELRMNGSCSDDSPCDECVITIVIPDCDNDCDPDVDPCDFVDIDFTPDPVLGDICCYTTSIDNQYCDDYFKGIKITLTGSATISQVQALNGWTISQLDPLNAEIYPPTSFIGLGMMDIFTICANNDGTTFNVQISWLYTDDDGNCISICPEDFDVTCDDEPGGCLEIVQDSIDCDNNLYCFRVINTTDPEIIIRSVEFIQLSPSGASLTPNPYSINPLMSGDTSEWVCVNYDALGSPNLCFLLVGHEADLPAGDPITWCCVDDEKYFINIEDDCGPNCDPDIDPCDLVDVDFTPDPVLGDICCYTTSIDNQYCDDYFKGIKITLTGSATISQVQALNGWTISQLDPLNAEIYPPTSFIGLGMMDIFTICANNDGTTFNVQISWLYADDDGNCISICPEDFDVTCDDEPGGCLEIVQDSIDCDNNQYCFRVINTTEPEIIIRSVEFIQLSPSGASLTPNPYSINPLMSGDTSEWVCVNYDALGSPNLCFLLVGHEADLPAGDPITWCCVDDEKYFINIEDDCGPPCPVGSNVCDDIAVSLTADPVTGDECCFVGSITNDYCETYFKGVKITTQSPATISQVQSLNGWVINQINSTEAEIYPPGNFVALGTENIFSVCNSSNTNPFVVTVSWLVPDDQGNCLEECMEDFDLSCPVGNPLGGCITVVEEDLLCEQDMYCFKITNNTIPGFTIRSLDLISISPAGTTLSPNPISIPPLAAGQTSDWICVEYNTIDEGEEVCFYVVGHNEDITQGGIPTWCCATQEPSCFTVDCEDLDTSDCIQVVQDSLSCTDRNYCFKIVNNTQPSFSISSVDLINIMPQTASFLNTPISIPTLMVGDTSDWICVEYAGVMPDDNLCFNVVAHLEDLGNGESPSWCCATTVETCVVIEDCETCCQDEQGFIDLVDQGFDLIITDCNVDLTTMQFDSCHWTPSAAPDWGDGSVSSSVITPANGTWTHSYATSGTYTICMDVYEGEFGESNCWQYTHCMDVTVECLEPEPFGDDCDLNLLRVPNGLTPNGDGINDVLIIESDDENDCPPISVTIYNRWGQMVYENRNYENEWTGFSRSGNELPDGTYYLVVAFDDDDQRETNVINTFIDIRR